MSGTGNLGQRLKYSPAGLPFPVGEVLSHTGSFW